MRGLTPIYSSLDSTSVSGEEVSSVFSASRKASVGSVLPSPSESQLESGLLGVGSESIANFSKK